MSRNDKSTLGYSLSWLGHLNAIREASKYSTSLIVEDDADWDIELRTQTPRIAPAVRNVSESADDITQAPYGLNWDILWLGHCGDSIPFGRRIIQFHDSSVPPYLHAWEKALSPDPKHTRWVHTSTGPVCTYAYALTKASATKILEQNDHGSTNFDIWLHLRCKSGQFRCITVNPELFHHHEMAGNKDSLINGRTTKVIESEMTDNIWHSARCNSASKSNDVVTCMAPKPDGV